VKARDGSPQIDEIRKKAASRERNDGGARQILELRKFLLRHAERKAKSRAIADLGVKRSYTKKELEKPFAVARLMFNGHVEGDPELTREFRLKIADSFLGASSALYGQPRASLPAPQPPPQLVADGEASSEPWE
jgi:hypothetical protein